ncbi:MAG TPA: hypothetical protein VFR35_07380 [Actinoplanes sp.]|nr:hypothetical protein [Actinoplanes sp.]
MSRTKPWGIRVPFSKENPHRDRNMLVAAVLALVALAMVLGGWIYTDATGRDTGSYEKFLALLVTVIGGALLNLWRQFKTERRVEDMASKVDVVDSKADTVVAQTNGALDMRIEAAVERRLSATGQTPLPGHSTNERYNGVIESGEGAPHSPPPPPPPPS